MAIAPSRRILRQKKGQVYTYAVFIIGVFIFAFLWIVLWANVDPIGSSVDSHMTQYNVANSSYDAYTLASTFMSNLWLFLLVIAIGILLIWGFHYSQRKGRVFYPE